MRKDLGPATLEDLRNEHPRRYVFVYETKDGLNVEGNGKHVETIDCRMMLEYLIENGTAEFCDGWVIELKRITGNA